MSTLEIKGLTVSVETEDGPKEILRGVDLTVKSGETHAIMGPNGSGKSTLAYSIAGHPKYTVTGGTVTLDGEDVLAMKRRRARPRRPLPRDAVPRRGPRCHGQQLPAHGQDRHRRRGAQAAHVGQGRQGGHGQPADGPRVRRAQRQRGLLRWREEAPRDPPDGAAQAQGGHPRRDRLRPRRRRAKIVSEGVNRAKESSDLGVLLITHYTRILRYIKPDFVHVFVDGKVVEEGGPELADRLEDEGYDRYLVAAPAVAAEA